MSLDAFTHRETVAEPGHGSDRREGGMVRRKGGTPPQNVKLFQPFWGAGRGGDASFAGALGGALFVHATAARQRARTGAAPASNSRQWSFLHAGFGIQPGPSNVRTGGWRLPAPAVQNIRLLYLC